MCDEYEDERTQAFWRFLDERERLASVNHEEPEEPLVPAAALISEAPKAKPRPAVR